MMEVIDSEACEIDRNKSVSFHTPTSVMSKVLKLKKKSKQGPDMLRTLRTVLNDFSDLRDIIHYDAINPSGDTMLNQCLAISKWYVDIEQELNSPPLKGIIQGRSYLATNVRPTVRKKFSLTSMKIFV